ncbi:hypothetical protein Salat_0703000 [Sesamum alatum]|uniref:BED-type domain-containing protein n=1 Tax=Sesamum alatum TaxID=300844 RepID=A0AAE2CUT1_9LAMI|nr:hypothetical protein Salat_0703000 [Sesamum alatum]
MQNDSESLQQTFGASNEEIANEVVMNSIGTEKNVEPNKENESLQPKPKHKKKSAVWEDFTEEKDADGVMKISCVHCKRMYIKTKTTPTTQLHRHLRSCPKYLKAKADKAQDGFLQTQLDFMTSSMDPSSCPSLYSGKFDMEQMKESLAHWIMMLEHPFSIVEEDGLNLFCRRGMPEWRVMTRNIIKAHCIKAYESEKKKLKGLLKNVNKISLTTDY